MNRRSSPLALLVCAALIQAGAAAPLAPARAPLPPPPTNSQPRLETLSETALTRAIEEDWLRQADDPPSPVPAAARPYPIASHLDRGRRLAADLQKAGQNVQPALALFDALESRLNASPAAALGPAGRDLYLDTRRALRRLVFSNPVTRLEQLLFVKRFTQETYPDICLNHMPWVSRPGGDICVLSASPGASLFSTPAPALRSILNQALGPGHVHGLDLDWAGQRVVFGYARAAGTNPPSGWLDRTKSFELRRSVEPIHIYEIGADGRGLRQLTDGEWSDLDPAIAPNGDIVFVSERCGTSLQCNEYDKDETSCNLYVMSPDGQNIRRLSANKDGDYLPHILADGSVCYTRWEYHERSWAYIQAPWFIRPDGTGADALFKQHFVNPWAIEDARSIPGSGKLVAVAAGHHTLAAGPVVIVDHALGINTPQAIAIVTPLIKPPEGGMDGRPVPQGGVPGASGFYSAPWALSETTFLVSHTYGPERDPKGYGLYLIDVFGNKELLYRDPDISCSLPIPLRPRTRPPVCSPVQNPSLPFAVCSVSDASFGAPGLARDQVRFIRVAEPVGWPYDNTRGGLRYGEDHRYGGPGADFKNLLNWTPVRILGDVPVAPDGSARFAVPPDTAVYFQLLDENRMELRRMRSFISFQPGENRGCVGCHESRAAAPPAAAAPTAGPGCDPAPLIPPPWGPSRPVSFLRDIQPVFDRHCAACHSGLKPAGGLDFQSGLTSHDPDIPGYGHNRAYDTLVQKGLVARSAARAQDASVTPPLAYGARRSRLMAVLAASPHRERANLSPEDRLRLSMWIDANAPYHDEFVDKRPETAPYDLAADTALAAALTALHTRRCAPCHTPAAISSPSWINLQSPEKTLFLTAPMPQAKGGLGRCGSGGYTGVEDADYLEARRLARQAAAKAWQSPRRDLRILASERAAGAPH